MCSVFKCTLNRPPYTGNIAQSALVQPHSYHTNVLKCRSTCKYRNNSNVKKTINCDLFQFCIGVITARVYDSDIVITS